MYEAMRQHAPISTRAAGVSATLLLAAGAGHVLLTGFGEVIVKAVQRPMTVISLAPPPARPIDPPLTKFDPTNETLPTPQEAPSPPEIFWYEAPKPEDGGASASTPSHVDPPPAHPPLRIAPKLMPAASPTYPPAAIRAGMQGTSAITLCIDAKGRVTQAMLARSSGHDVLDNAALQWVRALRFAPGTIDGAAQPVCGHPVDYVWNLETLRR